MSKEPTTITVAEARFFRQAIADQSELPDYLRSIDRIGGTIISVTRMNDVHFDVVYKATEKVE